MKKLFTVKQAKSFKVASEELLEEVDNILPADSDVEDVGFEYNGVDYAFVEVAEDDEIDESKYTYGCSYWQLVSYDKGKYSYPNKDNITERFNVIAICGYSKCGSYFSDYEWYYDEPKLKMVSVKTVPEVVIPEHEEVEIK